MTPEKQKALDAIKKAEAIYETFGSDDMTNEDGTKDLVCIATLLAGHMPTFKAALTAQPVAEGEVRCETVAYDKTPDKWAFDGHPKMDKWMRHLASYGCHMNMAEWHAFCVDVHDSITAATAPKNCDALVMAAQAVIDRWDTPAWKDVEHTGKFINKLRQQVAAHRAQQEGK